MTKYQIFIAEEYDKQIAKINPKERKLIEKKMTKYVIPQLKFEPHFGVNIKKTQKLFSSYMALSW